MTSKSSLRTSKFLKLFEGHGRDHQTVSLEGLMRRSFLFHLGLIFAIVCMVLLLINSDIKRNSNSVLLCCVVVFSKAPVSEALVTAVMLVPFIKGSTRTAIKSEGTVSKHSRDCTVKQ